MSDLPAIPLSVLDLAPVVSGSTPADALHDTLELARATERLGYTRYWLAEHHNMPGIASSAPPVVIAAVAAATTTLRVGSGGVMLPNHPPLVVAEQFGTLEALHPGRIDLGIGRAPGTDQVTASALRRSADPLSADDFPRQLTELRSYFSGDWPDGSPYRGVVATPGLGASPDLWLLGSSGYSAQVAGLLGLPFSFAHHFSAQNTEPALELYRSRFTPSEVLDRPYAALGVSVTLADDDERARWLAAPSALSFLRLRSGRPGPLPTPEEAAERPLSPAEQAAVAPWRGGHVVGGPDTVRRELADLLDRTGADELIVTTQVSPFADRVRSYELLAQLFDLRPAAQGELVGAARR